MRRFNVAPGAQRQGDPPQPVVAPGQEGPFCAGVKFQAQLHVSLLPLPRQPLELVCQVQEGAEPVYPAFAEVYRGEQPCPSTLSECAQGWGTFPSAVCYGAQGWKPKLSALWCGA